MRTEVLVTPFQTTKGDTAIISVVLHEDVGVVGKLLEALWWRNVNVELQESSSIDHLDLHRVGMIVDLGDESRELETPPRVQEKYRAYAANFPITSRRYLQLFDLIVAHCGDALWWHSEEEGLNKRLIPELYIRPLYRRTERNPSSVLLEKSQDNRHTEITLPVEVRDHIQGRLGTGSEPEEELSYVFVSDTNDRTLRTFFLPETRSSRLVHVGIYHGDYPGTLAGVLDVIADAEFNIVTSLLRKHSKDKSVWEGVLEYCGKDDPPPTMPSCEDQFPGWYRETLLPWVHTKLSASSRLHRIAGCGVAIGPPRYPKRYGGVSPENLLDVSPSGDRPQGPLEAPNTVVISLLDQRRTDLEKRLPSAERNAAGGLISTVLAHRRRIEQRTVFLSYPKTAAAMVDRHMRTELEPPMKPFYHLTQLQKEPPSLAAETPAEPPDESSYNLNHPQDANDDIQAEAVALIREADYFLAIWHPEENKDGRRYQPTKISPWMFFEYGVARALSKPWVVACHKQLEEDINPFRLVGLQRLITYVDENFSETVKDIAARCALIFSENP